MDATEQKSGATRPRSRRRDLMLFAGLGVLGLVAGAGVTTAGWTDTASFSDLTIVSGELSIQEGEVTRWERYYDYDNSTPGNQVSTDWQQVPLDAPLTGASENIWITDLTIVNEGNNLVADMETDFQGNGYVFNDDSEENISKQWSGVLADRVEHSTAGLNTLTTAQEISLGEDPFQLDETLTAHQQAYLTSEGGQQIDEEGFTVPLEQIEIPKGTNEYTFALGGSHVITDEDASGNPTAYAYAENRPILDIGSVSYNFSQVIDNE